MKRIAIVAVAVVAAVVVAGAVTASAASLGAVSSRIFSASGSVTYPTATRSISNLTLTTAGSPATVSGLTLTITGSSLSTLNGQAVTVALLNSSGAQVQSVTGTLATGTNLTVGSTTATATLSVTGSPLASSFASWAVFIAGVQALGPAADPTQRVVALGHGTITVTTTPTNWQDTVVPPGGANSATDLGTITPSDINSYSACLTVVVTGTSTTAQAWGFTIDYSKPPFYGTQPSLDYQTRLVSKTGTVLSLAGNTGYATLTSSQSLSILICDYSGVTPVDEPSAYTVSAQVHGATWTATQACIDRTITGNGTFPFSFGWSTSFNMTDAINLLKANDAGSPRAFVYEANPTTPGTYTAGTTTYSMVNYSGNALAGTGSIVAELCVSQY